jgi:hypothetical protein
MQPLNKRHPYDLDRVTWQLLVNIWLTGELISLDLQAGDALDLILDTLAELGIPSEALHRIAGSLEKAVHNAIRFNHQNGLDWPLMVCLYAQQTHVDNLQRKGVTGVPTPVQGYIEKGGVHAELFCNPLDIGKHLQDGWGFFLLERIVPQPGVPIKEPHCSIELFLYTEG